MTTSDGIEGFRVEGESVVGTGSCRAILAICIFKPSLNPYIA